MRLPEALRAALEAVRRHGRPRLVGGCVRDWLLGLEPEDFDVEVAGVDFEGLRATLAPFGATDVVGRSFGVIRLQLDGRTYDFSLPRRESKTGAGHRGFRIEPDPSLDDAAAAARRDFTVNAMMYDPFSGVVVDPHGGRADLEAGVLRHTSPAFGEDPLRVLRAFQLAGRFGFRLAAATAELCRTLAPHYAELAQERVWGEWQKWAEKSRLPARGLAVLEETGWLLHFPELAALRGTPQEPAWHPEGDVFTHTQRCLDALAALDEWQAAPARRRGVLMLAVLAHDFGKPSTTQRAERRGIPRWTSPGHEAAGGAPTESFLRRIGAPQDTAPAVVPLVLSHLAHHHGGDGSFSDASMRRLARKLAPATVDDLALVMTADALGRPPLDPGPTLALIRGLREHARALALAQAAPRPLVLGRHLLALGLVPGPSFKPLLDAAFEAQLDGAFADEAGGVEWLRRHLCTGR